MRQMTGSVTAVLLAAGLSTRMGTPKPLLPWAGRTLVEFQVAELRAAGVSEVIVVTGYAATEVAAALHGSGARLVHNAAYAEGRAGSVRAGAAAVRDGCDVLVLNVDQPRPASITRAVINAGLHHRALITLPVVAGRRGHPTLFAAALLPELRTVTEATEGLRAVLRAHAADILEVEVGDPRACIDLNTPDEYRDALRAFNAE